MAMAGQAMTTQAQTEAFDRLMAARLDAINALLSELDESASTGRDIFPLMKLPPELREHIYKFALVTGPQIDVTRRIDKAATEKALKAHERKLGLGLVTKHQRPTQSYNISAKTFDSKLEKKNRYAPHGLTVAVLRISKQVYAEAHPVLYGCNRFRFPNSTMLAYFLARSEPGVQLIEDVEIGDIVAYSTSFTTHMLSGATRLRRLSLTGNLDCMGGINTPSFVSNLLRCLILPIHHCSPTCSYLDSYPCICATAEERQRVVGMVSFDFNSLRCYFQEDNGSRRPFDPETDSGVVKTAILKLWEEEINGEKARVEVATSMA
ncbi:uncharacterized protein LTR77_002744 [Saxophila tyrrhenica]|uniref:DUF7730 domain-containing protein n=1 Tax=Saxophila tyrrhenica TaxID=1690608 RepID=A0AAV9PI88_9PEZI|nr:hypothetical protein LTR77_002744 [Saxophila tyrrhenica]